MRNFLRSLVVVALVTASADAWARNFGASDVDPLYQPTLGNQINVGNGAHYTVSSYGDFNLNMYDNTVTGPSLIQGNVAIGGNGNFSMSDGELDGDLDVHNGAKVTFSGPARHYGGTNTYADNAASPINRALADYWNLANNAATATSTGAVTNTTNFSLSLSGGTYNGTINGNKNYSITASGKVVLNLTDLVLTGGSVTLNGDGTGNTLYVINVSRNFSLNNSHISLGMNLNSSQVLFNVLGTGGQVSLNQGTYMSGILLAAQRKVDLSGGKVFGRVIGNQVNITSGGQVVSR